jgi:cytochrome c-type biogenesis protein CcmH/NrfF
MKIITVALAAFMLLAPMSATAQAPLGQDGDALYDSLTRELSCLCGCNQTVKACPHTNCDSAVPTRNRIKELIGQGKNHDEIIAVFIKEKGQIILSQPRHEGFNLVGYIFPSVAIIVVGGLVLKLLKGWTRSVALSAPQTVARRESADGAGGLLTERMKKELSEFED